MTHSPAIRVEMGCYILRIESSIVQEYTPSTGSGTMESREPTPDDQFHDFRQRETRAIHRAELQRLKASRASRRAVTTARSDQQQKSGAEIWRRNPSDRTHRCVLLREAQTPLAPWTREALVRATTGPFPVWDCTRVGDLGPNRTNSSPDLGRLPFWERPSRALPDPEEFRRVMRVGRR